MGGVAAPVPKREGTREGAEAPARAPLAPRMQPIGGAAAPPASQGPQTGERPLAAPGPAKAAGSALGRVIFVAGNALGALSNRLSVARRRGAAAVEEFQRRPEHVRYRAYALGAYALILAGTLVAQLYRQNALGAYVRVKRVDIPETTEVFVRNDSDRPWTRLHLQLNGLYGYRREALPPGGYVQLKAEAFSAVGPDGKPSRAPRGMRIDRVTVDTDQGHTDVELER